MNLVVQAEGVPPTSVNVKSMIVPVKKWPFPGTVIPVHVDRANPQNVKILFDKMQIARGVVEGERRRARGDDARRDPDDWRQADWAAAGIPPDKADIVAQIQQMFPGARIQVAGSRIRDAAAERGRSRRLGDRRPRRAPRAQPTRPTTVSRRSNAWPACTRAAR